MKKIGILVVMLFFKLALNAQENTAFFNQANEFFAKNVAEGAVDYQGILSDKSSLNSLVSQIEVVQLTGLDATEKKALLINAYNILVIKGIVENYPTKSPLNINGFFDGIKYRVGGDKITLNQLEKDYLIKSTGDERLHFVLVCAALSCPQIASFAYLPNQLEVQINERTQLALNNQDFIRVESKEKKVLISEIFKWYEGDFKGKASSLIEYLNKYRSDKIPKGYKVDYYTYNWTLNGQNRKESLPKKTDELTSNLLDFTPSVLLNKGQVELNSFYNIYTQDKIRDMSGETVILQGRQSFFNAQYSFSYGVSKSARLNLGLDVWVTSFSDGNSPFSPVFQSGDFNEIVLAGFGPNIRFTPFKKLSNLSVRSTFLFPGGQNLENREGRFVAHDRFTSFSQVFYDMEINTHWRLFLEAGLIYRFAKLEDQTDFFRTPLTGILSYFPTPKASIFALYQYSPRFEQVSNGFDEAFGLSRWFQQAGAGLKYQISSKTGIELSYTNFFASRNDGGGSTLNLGFRYIR
ncbi:MAG: hypothetical protein ACJAXX_001676 [Roseivirga sp.]|jgi:hypothetical protein